MCTCSTHTADCTMRDFNTFFVGSRSFIFYIMCDCGGGVSGAQRGVGGGASAVLGAGCWEGAGMAGIEEKSAELNKNARF